MCWSHPGGGVFYSRVCISGRTLRITTPLALGYFPRGTPLYSQVTVLDWQYRSFHHVLSWSTCVATEFLPSDLVPATVLYMRAFTFINVTLLPRHVNAKSWFHTYVYFTDNKASPLSAEVFEARVSGSTPQGHKLKGFAVKDFVLPFHPAGRPFRQL